MVDDPIQGHVVFRRVVQQASVSPTSEPHLHVGAGAPSLVWSASLADEIAWLAHRKARATSYTGVHEAVDEPQLSHDRRREDERVKVWLAHTVVEAVDRILAWC